MNNRHLLPDYLRMRADAAPRAESVVVCGETRITVITPCLIRIEQGEWTDEATQTVLNRSFGACTPEVSAESGTTVIRTGMLTIRCAADRLLAEGLTITRETSPAFFWRFGMKPMQNLGGTTSTLDVTDGPCPIEDGVCAIDGFSWIDDSQSALMNQDGWFSPRSECTDVYFFGYGHDYTACVQDYYRLTGIPEMLPAWALGNWWSRYHPYSDQEYMDLMDRFQRKDVPLSVGIVDMDWHLTSGENRSYSDGWTGYTWNEKLFPDYKGFIRGLHDRGLRTALNLHPAQGVRPYEKQYADMAKAMGLEETGSAAIPFNCLDPNFLKAYFEVLHFPYEEDGVDFWWMDWQQGTDYAKVIGEGFKPTGLEKVTPLWMLNHMHYMASKRKGQRGLIFSRYSGYGSQRYPLGFSGDTFITWRSLRFQPYFTVTASNIGYGWWSHDIGGHMNGYRDDELTVRWIQFGVFSPIFRLHSTSNVFLGREPWNYNKRAELIITDFMRLRHQLFPYLNTMSHRNYHELLPLMRPMYHVHPEAEEAYKVPNQYWFGSEMIVAPITDKADQSDLGVVDVWLPKGRWVDAFTGYVYKGGEMLGMHRPMEQMPLLLKAGGIVPLQAHKSQSRRLGGSESMEAWVAAGADGAFTLYEDDGETLDYQQGVYCQTPLSLCWKDTQADFTIGAAQGATSLIPATRSWKVHFRGFRRDSVFTLNGKPLSAEYDPDSNSFAVTVDHVDSLKGAVIHAENTGGLLHDNSDCETRIIDALTRAQTHLFEKNEFRRCIDRYKLMLREGGKVQPWHMETPLNPSLGGYIYEMMHQRYE